MPNITEMTPSEFRELLHTLVNEELFKSRERLAALLTQDSTRERHWMQNSFIFTATTWISRFG